MNSFEAASHIAKEVASHTESLILEQLNDFVKRGLIVIESGPMTLVSEHGFDGAKVRIQQSVMLRLKDREYIESLEAENKKLKDQVKTLLSIRDEHD